MCKHFTEPEGHFLPSSAGNESHPPITQNVSLEPFCCEYTALGAYEQDFTLSSHAFGAFLSARKSSALVPFRKSVSLTFIPFFSLIAFASRKDSHYLEADFKAVFY